MVRLLFIAVFALAVDASASRAQPLEATVKLEAIPIDTTPKSVAGVVVDEAGQPIAGVRVEAQTPVTGFHQRFVLRPELRAIDPRSGELLVPVPRESVFTGIVVQDGKPVANTGVSVQPRDRTDTMEGEIRIWGKAPAGASIHIRAEFKWDYTSLEIGMNTSSQLSDGRSKLGWLGVIAWALPLGRRCDVARGGRFLRWGSRARS